MTLEQEIRQIPLRKKKKRLQYASQAQINKKMQIQQMGLKQGLQWGREGNVT